MLLKFSRAHLHSPLARAVFETIDGKVCKLLKAMYGLRDAGAAFDGKVLNVMNLMGVSLGKFGICVGHRKVMDTLVKLVRCCDDFSLSGRQTQNVVATSSGEAEFYALTKSASRALGAVANMAKVVKPRVRVASTTSKAIGAEWASETSPYPSLVGTRGGGTP